jgi:hypothetical protein
VYRSVQNLLVLCFKFKGRATTHALAEDGGVWTINKKSYDTSAKTLAEVCLSCLLVPSLFPAFPAFLLSSR